MTNILFEESFKGAALVPSYTSKRGEPIAAKGEEPKVAERRRANGRQKEESHQNLPTFAGSGSSPAGIAAKNLPTFAAKNLST
mmetsp:Transcript_27217/g.40644  ORF Transcript_27217/g.40644 Transcript_27217/m.40644 type:complete len:83 (+) Transcript_27217:427-675(+)